MPTIIDELAMTLSLDPTGFKAGADAAKAAEANLLTQIMASLAKIEQATKDTAANTTRVQKTAAEQAAAEAEKAEKAQTAAAKRTAQEHDKAAKQSAEAFGKVGESIKRAGVELLAFLGISMTVGGMERLFMDISKTNVQAGYLSQTLGMSTRELTEWQGAASRLGATAEGVAAGFGTIQQQFETLSLTGQSTMLPVLRNLLGIEMQSSPGVNKTPTALLLEIADQVKARNLSGPRVQAIMDRLGMGGLAPMVMQGRPAIERELATQREIGSTGIMDAEQSREMLNALDKVQGMFRSIARVVTMEVSPAVTQIANQIFDWLSKNRTWIEEYLIDGLNALGRLLIEIKNDFVEAFNSQTAKELGGAIKAVATEVDTLVKATVGWKNLIEGVLELWTGWKFAKMLANIGLVRGALGLIGVGAPAVGGVAAGAAGTAGAVGGVVGGIAAAAPELVIAGMLGTLYMEFKNASQADQAKSLGFEKAPMAVPGSFFTMPGYKRDGKMYRPDEVQAEIDAHLKELGEAADKQKEAANALEDAAREQRLKDEEGLPMSTLSAQPGTAGFKPEGAASSTAVNKSLPAGMRALLDTIADPESRGDYGARNPAGAAGRYQFLASTWERVAAVTGLHSMTPENQDINAAWLARDEYRKRSGGRDLDTDVNDPARAGDIVAALRGTWVSMPGGSQSRGATMEDFRNRLRIHQGAEGANAKVSALTGASPLGAGTTAERSQLAFAGPVSRSSSSSTHIGEVHVHTAATDAGGIARDLKSALRRYDYVAQADVGLA
jgi:Transglycosylase-like domain